MEKQKFDGYANEYDTWFMENINVFNSELKLFKKVIGDTQNKKVLSVGCGSGLFEKASGNLDVEGLEPSVDMANIAKKRGINCNVGTIQEAKLEKNYYDMIYFNGSSSYIPDLFESYKKCYDSLKDGGKIVLIDVPKESAYGLMYLLATSLNTFEHKFMEGVMPKMPYPLELVKFACWHTSEEKIDILKEIGMKNFEFYQTLLNNPVYTNDDVEEVVKGYKAGGYVAIIAQK